MESLLRASNGVFSRTIPLCSTKSRSIQGFTPSSLMASKKKATSPFSVRASMPHHEPKNRRLRSAKPFTLSPTRQSRYGDGARYRRVNGTICEAVIFAAAELERSDARFIDRCSPFQYVPLVQCPPQALSERFSKPSHPSRRVSGKKPPCLDFRLRGNDKAAASRGESNP